jgi:hypothetical protein
MKIVLFLGAGFSAAYGLPVMKDFFQVARTHRRLCEDDRRFLQDIQEQARQAAGTIASEVDDLEHVLSFALMARNLDRIATDGSVPNADRLCHILALVYGDVIEAVKNYDGEGLMRLLRCEERTNQHTITVITTNYDPLVEVMLRPHGIPVSLAGVWKSYSAKQQRAYDCLYSDDGPQCIRLCKLHGSVNWYDNPTDSSTFLVADKRHSRQYFDPEERVAGIVLPEICLNGFTPPSCPILVPPTLFKIQSDVRFDRVWQEAGLSIQNAERLMFIGYSFPPSDTHMKYFIGANLARNTNHPQVQILDPNASNICEALRKDDLFGQHFKKKLHPIDTKWQEYSGSIV